MALGEWHLGQHSNMKWRIYNEDSNEPGDDHWDQKSPGFSARRSKQCAHLRRRLWLRRPVTRFGSGWAEGYGRCGQQQRGKFCYGERSFRSIWRYQGWVCRQWLPCRACGSSWVRLRQLQRLSLGFDGNKALKGELSEGLWWALRTVFFWSFFGGGQGRTTGDRDTPRGTGTHNKSLSPTVRDWAALPLQNGLY